MRLERLYQLQDMGKIEIVPFFYSAPFITPGALDDGLSAVVNVPIQSDSHFVCRYLTGQVYDEAAAPVPVDPEDVTLLINLFDTSSGRSLMDNPVPWQTIVGTARLPYVMAEPWLIRAGGQVQVTLQNIGATGDDYDRVNVVLSGMKIYQFGSQLPPDLSRI